MFIRNVLYISIINACEASYEAIEDYQNVYEEEYMNLDESSIVKVEFSKTLSGMMSAMEEIQARADNLIGGIVKKEDELAKLEVEAEKAEHKRRELENHSNRMLDEKKLLEDTIEDLINEKKSKEDNIKSQEERVTRLVTFFFSSTILLL